MQHVKKIQYLWYWVPSMAECQWEGVSQEIMDTLVAGMVEQLFENSYLYVYQDLR